MAEATILCNAMTRRPDGKRTKCGVAVVDGGPHCEAHKLLRAMAGLYSSAVRVVAAWAPSAINPTALGESLNGLQDAIEAVERARSGR